MPCSYLRHGIFPIAVRMSVDSKKCGQLAAEMFDENNGNCSLCLASLRSSKRGLAPCQMRSLLLN